MMHHGPSATKTHHPSSRHRHTWSLLCRFPMASLLAISLLSLLLFFLSLSPAFTSTTDSTATNLRARRGGAGSPGRRASMSPSVPRGQSSPAAVQQACKAAQFPDTCHSSLVQSPSVTPIATPAEIILAAISVSAKNLKTAQSNARSILDSSAGYADRINAATNCIEHLANSERRLAGTADALPRGRVKDARAWGSAALLYQYDCFNALKYVNVTEQINQAMWFLISLTQQTSNAISMVAAYQRFGSDMSNWMPPQTERDGYWGDKDTAGQISQEGDFNGGFPVDLPPPHAKVCKDGGDGCYRTVQEAVNAAPDFGTGKFVIHINEGVYQETVRIPYEKTNIVFVGDGIGKTVITGSLDAGMVGFSTYNTATVGVNGDGFMAKGLTFENTAGPNAHQAVAFRSDSDLSVLEEVEFLGHQDTLYARSLRQFYKFCRIVGTVDFIFGNSASVFQNCSLEVQPRLVNPEKGETNAYTAHGRTDPAQATGFVFRNCLVNGTAEYMQLFRQKPGVHKDYLGRPWKEYSRTVFIKCYLEELVRPEGWLPWSGEFALQTLFYGEFESAGPGADRGGRVAWSNQIPVEHVDVYSTENFIQGREWIPSLYT